MAPTQRFRAQLARAKKGNTAAQAFVSDAYLFGEEGATKDLKLALKFCRMAAEAGHTDCQRNLAVFYDIGESVECDQRMAAAWCLRAASEGGHADAQFFTAQRYKSGNGHDAPNMKEAVKWYQAAAVQGHAQAELHLANCYDRGDGVKQKRGLALKLWRRCAKHLENGDEAVGEYFNESVAAAHYIIGNCYRDGSNGVEVDMPVAMQWWTKAADLGDLFAQVTVGGIYLVGFDEYVPIGTFDRDVPLGMKYLRGALLAVAAAERKKRDLSEGEATATSKAEALIGDFHCTKSCMGCGSPKARKLCSGCLNFDQTKVRYCGEACQRIHWRHKTASHKAECGSRAPGGGGNNIRNESSKASA